MINYLFLWYNLIGDNMNCIEKCEQLINLGVKIVDINHTYIDDNVIIDEGTIIYPNVAIRGNTKIGKNNIIDMNTIIIDSKIGNNNKIIFSYIENSEIGNDNNIGPFSHLEKNAIITNNVVIGNYVEVKNSIIGEESKAKHLSYIGDANLGKKVNVGAGTIFANYNSKTKEKNKIKIEDNVSIGSNSVLIAPVTLKKSSFIAAGSTITNNVEEHSLGIARSRQVNKPNFIEKE